MEDRFGQKITTRPSLAADAYNRGVDLMLTALPGAEPCFAQAIAADPEFALAHIARARALQPLGRPGDMAQEIETARALCSKAGAREGSHIEVIARFLNGDAGGALDTLKNHMRDYPRDGFVLSLTLGVYGLLGFSGAADHHEQQRDLIESLAPEWGDDWWFLGYRGWAHVETGNAAFGAPLIDHSLTERRVNGNAAHGRAHAYYELGQTRAGMAFLDSWLPDYVETGSLHPHLSWHLALFALREGDSAKAAALYAERFKPSLGKQPPFFTIVDAASFNWRVLLRGMPREEADTEEVAAYARLHFSRPGVGFANVHAAYALAANGKHDALEEHVAAVAQLALEHTHPSATTVHLICCGIQRHATGDFAGAVHYLEQALPDLPRIGGSHAQRDGVLETLVHACLRSNQPAKAEALLAKRLGLRSIWV